MSWNDSAWPYTIVLFIMMMVAIFWKRKSKKHEPYRGVPQQPRMWLHDHTKPLVHINEVDPDIEDHKTPKFGESYKKLKADGFFDDFEIDRNEVKFLIEVPHFCDHHRFTLDSVHFHAGDPDRDDLMFSCKNTVTVAVDAPFGEPQEEVWACSATRTIERKVFWEGPVKIREQYVDPEWERNMASYVYNQNMRAFEREMYGMSPIIHIP